MILVIAWYTVLMARAYQESGFLINMIRRQGMLSQKFAKEIFRYHAQPASGRGNAGPELAETGRLFKTTLAGLIEGGEIFADLEGKKPVPTGPAHNPSIVFRLKTIRRNWTELEKRVSRLSGSDFNDSFPGVMKEISGLEQKISDDINQLSTLYEREAGKKNYYLITMEMIFLAVCLFLGILGYIFGRKAAAGIVKASWTAQEIAIGNLRVDDIYGKTGDEVGVMTTALTDLKKTVSNIVERIQSASSNIKKSVVQITSISKEASEHSRNQAASLEETTVTLEQLTETVKQNAENAQNANNLAQNTVRIATVGESVVQETMKSMAKVTESSRQIDQIIGVVNEIAFKTNLLALNAAVEAARAGDQGRGFGVVAGEVKALASQSAAAVKEIKILIEDSRRKVIAGNRLVEETGEKLGEIIAGVKKLARSVSNISQASEEQSINLNEIYQTVKNMEVLVQENARKVEDSSVKAGEMIDVVESLEKAIYIFTSSDTAVEGKTGLALDSWTAVPLGFETTSFPQVRQDSEIGSYVDDLVSDHQTGPAQAVIEGFDEF